MIISCVHLCSWTWAPQNRWYFSDKRLSFITCLSTCSWRDFFFNLSLSWNVCQDCSLCLFLETVAIILVGVLSVCVCMCVFIFRLIEGWCKVIFSIPWRWACLCTVSDNLVGPSWVVRCFSLKVATPRFEIQQSLVLMDRSVVCHLGTAFPLPMSSGKRRVWAVKDVIVVVHFWLHHSSLFHRCFYFIAST